MFFVGASNVLLAMLWWASWLVSSRWPVFAMPQPHPYAGWLHAFVMQYQMLASFIFGFLLTVFPRWMGLGEFERWRYAPVGLGLFGGQLMTLLGAMGWSAGIAVGLLMTVAGWVAVLVTWRRCCGARRARPGMRARASRRCCSDSPACLPGRPTCWAPRRSGRS
jgi:uncharacterized protein involved in response to NO